jgi:oligoendopeptidase F
MEAGNGSHVEREEIQDAYKWNLKDLFSSDQEWKSRKDELSGRLLSLSDLKGTLAHSASKLKSSLDFYFDLKKEVARLSAYAAMYSDQDTRQSVPLSMKQEISQLGTRLNSLAAFIAPEILEIPEDTLQAFYAGEPALGIYRHYLADVFRRSEHTLNEKEEKIVAEAGLMSDTPQEVNSILTNADLPYKTITLSDGKQVRVDPTNYVFYRASPNRSDRIKVFESFFSSLKSFERTLGTQLYGQMKRDTFYKNVRNYGSCLESALHQDNIPMEVYYNLIKNINANLPSLHRYLVLRKKMLGLDELHYYDSYSSMVKEIDLRYGYSEAKEAIQKSLSCLGKTYSDTLEKAFSQRWIDIYPNAGKRSGAYSEGDTYDVHPYILTNFNGRFDDVETLAHELGHTAHSYFSNKTQPFVNSRYPIFLAEVASTVNEALLMDYGLNSVTNEAQRLSILVDYLEGFRTTLFRQAQFAEFELQIHQEVEKGESLTGDKFTELYQKILKKHFGHAEGICTIDDLYGIEWAYIPHFYYNFYVFQYSTSFIAAQAIASRILRREENMVAAYIDFLKSGGSDYGIPTLKKLGIDMLSSYPFEQTMQKMNYVIDSIEKLASL